MGVAISYILERKEMLLKLNDMNTQEYKIKGWVARDKNVDGFWGNGLILHACKPYRDGNEWSSKTIAMHLRNDFFPELTWEDEPIEVELTIKKI